MNTMSTPSVTGTKFQRFKALQAIAGYQSTVMFRFYTGLESFIVKVQNRPKPFTPWHQIALLITTRDLADPMVENMQYPWQHTCCKQICK